MRRVWLLVGLGFLFIIPGSAGAATITASQTTLNPGTTVLELTLDPEGVPMFAWLVVLGTVGLSIDSISGVTPAGTDCFPSVSTLSFNAVCVGVPLIGAAVVAQVTITGQAGDTLSLVGGSFEEFNTFEEFPFTPGVLATVIPEPTTGLLVATGLLGLGIHRRRAPRSDRRVS